MANFAFHYGNNRWLILLFIFYLRCSAVRWGHNGGIRWKGLAHYWSFVMGIHRSLADSPYKVPMIIWCFLWIWIQVPNLQEDAWTQIDDASPRYKRTRTMRHKQWLCHRTFLDTPFPCNRFSVIYYINDSFGEESRHWFDILKLHTRLHEIHAPVCVESQAPFPSTVK